MSHAPTGSEQHGRVEVLDLLRLLAVFAVILFHYGFRGAAADGFTQIALPDLLPIAKYGYLGVQLFFVISGFVIAYSAEGRNARGFIVARITRIYPGFVFCMTATFLMTLAIGAPRFEASFTQWIANLFIVAPALKQPFMDGAYWSIVYEITFYGWVFALISLGLFRRGIDWIVVAWLGASMLNEYLLGSNAVRRLLITDESAFFAAGLMLYELYRGRRDRVAMLLLALCAVAAINQAILGSEWTRAHYHVFLDNRVIAALCVAAIAAVGLAMLVRRLPLPAGFVIAIGGLTYPLYLLHQHIGYMLLNRFAGAASPAVLIAAMAVVMVAASWVVWRFIERPAQKRMKSALTRSLDQFGTRLRPAQARVAAGMWRLRQRLPARGA